MAPDEYAAVERAVLRLGGARGNVLDVGSQDVNGTLKPIFNLLGCNYIGLDMEEGPNVDVVGLGRNMPFDDQSFDIVVSNSCFEHDLTWFYTLAEMYRVAKIGGMLLVGACSLGFAYHGYPYDYYRFTEDAFAHLIMIGCDNVCITRVDQNGPMRLLGSGIVALDWPLREAGPNNLEYTIEDFHPKVDVKEDRSGELHKLKENLLSAGLEEEQNG